MIRATLFDAGEQALCAYSETNYIGRRVGGARRKPTFGLEIRKVRNRMGAGANNSVDAFRNGFPTGASGGNRSPLRTYVETLHSQQNTTEKDLADVEIGAVKPDGEIQAFRSQRLWAIVDM